MEEMKQDQKTIGPLPGCQLEEALALVWDVFSTFESEELSQEALDELKRLVANNPDIREIMKGIDEVIDGEVVRDAIGEAPSE